MSKIYDCDTLGYCPFEAELNSSGFACRNNCGLGVDEDAPETWDEEDLEWVEDTDPEEFEPEIDESINPYDGTSDWQNDMCYGGEWE